VFDDLSGNLDGLLDANFSVCVLELVKDTAALDLGVHTPRSDGVHCDTRADQLCSECILLD
jgi:hypothetical protein